MWMADPIVADPARSRRFEGTFYAPSCEASGREEDAGQPLCRRPLPHLGAATPLLGAPVAGRGAGANIGPVATLPVHHFDADVYGRMVASGALDGEPVELLDGILCEMSPQRFGSIRCATATARPSLTDSATRSRRPPPGSASSKSRRCSAELADNRTSGSPFGRAAFAGIRSRMGAENNSGSQGIGEARHRHAEQRALARRALGA